MLERLRERLGNWSGSGVPKPQALMVSLFSSSWLKFNVQLELCCSLTSLCLSFLNTHPPFPPSSIHFSFVVSHVSRQIWSFLCGSSHFYSIKGCRKKNFERTSDELNSFLLAPKCLFFPSSDYWTQTQQWCGSYKMTCSFLSEVLPSQPTRLSTQLHSEQSRMLSLCCASF